MATGDTLTFSVGCVYHLTPSLLCTPLTFWMGRSWHWVQTQLCCWLRSPCWCLYAFANEQNLLHVCMLMCMHICRSMLHPFVPLRSWFFHLSCCISLLCILMPSVELKKKKSKQVVIPCKLSIMETLWITQPCLHDSSYLILDACVKKYLFY